MDGEVYMRTILYSSIFIFTLIILSAYALAGEVGCCVQGPYINNNQRQAYVSTSSSCSGGVLRSGLCFAGSSTCMNNGAYVNMLASETTLDQVAGRVCKDFAPPCPYDVSTASGNACNCRYYDGYQNVNRYFSKAQGGYCCVDYPTLYSGSPPYSVTAFAGGICDCVQSSCTGASCRANSFNSVWISGGFGSGTTGSCCGDDAGENIRSRTGGTDAPAAFVTYAQNTACCNSNTACVVGTSCTTSGSSSGSIPSRAYCNGGTWQGGDASSTACNLVVSSGRWGIGGDISGTECCGDDSSENLRSRVGGTFVPSTYSTSSSDNACCDALTDCVYNDTCTTSGSTIGTTTNGAYCSSGTWIGADASRTACDAIVGVNKWAPGTLVECCGDDTNERVSSRVCTSACTSSTTDDACCDSSSDCVYNGACFNTGYASINVGGTSDLDYCNNGAWQDCNTAAECPSGQVCTAGRCGVACTISSVVVSGSCGSNGYCDSSETLSVSVIYSGDCSAVRNVQVDISDNADTCTISFNGGIKGINWNTALSASGGVASTTYTLPTLPANCNGTILTDTYAAFRDAQATSTLNGNIIVSRSGSTVLPLTPSCASAGGACSSDSACCGYTDTTATGSYCSSGHCCKRNEKWDPTSPLENKCIRASGCGVFSGGLCNIGGGASYYTDPNCIDVSTNPDLACCTVYFGTQTTDWVNVTQY